MTTKPSSSPWADEPFALIDIVSHIDKGDHGSVYAASEMAQAHNVLIRGLNSIVQQGPHVPSKDRADFNARDVKDFLFYVHSWCKMTDHHHWVEESFMFPELDKFSGTPGLMETPVHQHELFHAGMEKLLAYAQATKPDEYRWAGEGGMKGIVESFSGHLINHLYEEVEYFLSLNHLDSDGLRQVWQKSENIAKQNGNIAMLYDVFPCVLGAADKTYEGSQNYPPLPWVLPYVIKYWFAWGNGAWRFSPCDFWGQPQPLAFVPQH